MNVMGKTINLKTNKSEDIIDVPRMGNENCFTWMQDAQAILSELKPHYEELTFSYRYGNPCILGERPATEAEVALAKDIQINKCLNQLEHDIKSSVHEKFNLAMGKVVYTPNRAILASEPTEEELLSRLEIVTRKVKELELVKAAGPKAVVEFVNKEYAISPGFYKINIS